jgi:hypothetical protein
VTGRGNEAGVAFSALGLSHTRFPCSRPRLPRFRAHGLSTLIPSLLPFLVFEALTPSCILLAGGMRQYELLPFAEEEYDLDEDAPSKKTQRAPGT